MTPLDPMAAAVDWLDAYRAARINQIVGMYSPDAVVECDCDGRKIIYGRGGIAAYWLHRFTAAPALELHDLRMNGGAVAVSYLIASRIVQALLDIDEDGLIMRSRCGPTISSFD